MYDNITKPSHYNWHPSGVEAKEVTDDLPRWLGDAITYIWRRNHKGQPIDDRRKAIERLNEATPERLETLEQMLTTEIVKPLLVIEPDPDPLLYDVRVLITASLLGISYKACQQMIDWLKSSLKYELDELFDADHDSISTTYTKRKNKMTTATKLREIDNGRQAEYRLNPSITFTDLGMSMEVSHLISSHSVLTGMWGHETMLFPSDGNGSIISYTDLYYMPGHVDHDEAVQSFLEENDHE